MIVSFTLTHKNSDEPTKVSTSLLEIFKFIRNTINEPRDWTVAECEGENEIDFCSAFYMIENYTEQTLPKTILSIPHE